MQVHCGEGVAIHTGPESCGVRREACVEALTGAGAGWVLSRESSIVQGADAVAWAEGNTARHVKRVASRPCVVVRPQHAPKLLAREPGDLSPGRRFAKSRVRIGKAGGP